MITVSHLTKRYGNFTAVDDLSFEIEDGHVYGFLGPNGAGKSTTMNIITGCLSASAGHIRIDGFDIFEHPEKAKRQIGYLPETPPLYMSETPAEYLRFVGEAKGLHGVELNEQIEAVIYRTHIEEVRNRRISALSKGYKQRVGIAQALLGNPKVIILDEPTVGLDPIQIIEIRDLIAELAETHTVIFSSHILSEVRAICDRILIISKGKLIAFDEPEVLEKKMMPPNEITFVTDASEDEVYAFLCPIEEITETTMQKTESKLTEVQIKTTPGEIYTLSHRLFWAFADGGRTLFEMNLKKANLEEVFIELTEKGSPLSDIEDNPASDETVMEEVLDE